MPVGITSNVGKTGRGRIIEVKNLRKEYPVLDETVVALERVNLAIPQGQICCIYGESGSGKSTLLHILGGVDRPTSGRVYLDGIDVYGQNEEQLAIFRRREVGLIYQFYNLIPVLNVVENMTLPVVQSAAQSQCHRECGHATDVPRRAEA